MMEARLTELEVKLAFAEDLLETLNHTVYPKFLCYPNPEARQSEVKQRGEGDFGLAAMILSTM